MLYGIFSDVHSNLEALDAVLDFLKKEGVGQYLCVGDLVGYGAQPRECIAKIRALRGKAVSGNHDWAASGRFALDRFNPVAKAAVEWTRDQLGAEELHYLKSLEAVYASEEITLVHGSLDEPEEFRYIVDAESGAATLELQRTKLCFVGHSHLPMILSRSEEGAIRFHGEHHVALKEGSRYLVNVGSVGQPRDGDPRASCAIFDSEKSFAQIRRVPYDFQAVQEKILRAGLPPILAARLSEGR